MKTFVLLFISCLFTVLANAQQIELQEYEGPHHKYGVKDSYGKILSKAIYDQVEVWGGKFARLTLHNQYGMMDITGKLVIPIAYDELEFAQGFSFIYVSKNQKIGAFQITGKPLLDVVYDEITDAEQGYWNFKLIRVKRNEKYGVYDVWGKEIVSPKYDKIYYYSLVDSIVKVDLNGKTGFVDTKGNTRIPIVYDEANYPTGYMGIVPVQLNDKWGLLSAKTGEAITPLKYDEIEIGYGVFPKVKLNEKYGFVNFSGKEIIPVQYNGAAHFSVNLALVGLDNKYGFIDTTGKVVIPLIYDGAESFSNGPFGMAKVWLNQKYGYVDTTGKVIIPIVYDAILPEEGGDRTRAIVMLDNLYGIIDYTGKIIAPIKYEEIGAPYFIPTRVKLNGKYGFIDSLGREITQPQYDKATEYFSDNTPVVQKADKQYILDKNGNEAQKIKKYDVVLGVGGIFQKELFSEVNVLIGHVLKPSYYFPGGVMGYRFGAESNFKNNPLFTIAPKIGWELSASIFSLRISCIDYIQNNKSEYRIVPELGISAAGIVNLSYGYGIRFKDAGIENLGQHRVSLTFNFNKKLLHNSVKNY